MNKTAYIFPGQGAQFVGMGKDLYNNFSIAKEIFEEANNILGFRITDLIFNGTEEDLRQTKVTQPAIFIHSYVYTKVLGEKFNPEMLAGHSLGEFSALTAGKSLSFKDGLILVSKRALAMQAACEIRPGTMAAVMGIEDSKVEEICLQVGDVVVPANYNCQGQLVISGSVEAIDKACELLKNAGAKRALVLKVGGAFHSPLMQPAAEELAKAINNTEFKQPMCPIYQNVNALPSIDPTKIKENLIAQLTSPVRWTQTIINMTKDGASKYVEAGPGNVLQGLVKKVSPEVETLHAQSLIG
ncbi:MAG: [acyl-carrier-protein] S-malonyltransferase [Bacteroidetes bacterium GWE2_29_8]|nr:MAG: [acyl-carrier-protein] S-malonyltransferase [Bacteroidetes bacterium GWE2_29_8]OFY14619.1 MAG: [acyl-carrier-protein] S-malonyltransferase [Bacteroidetes bacterium GWF2_29_10]